MSILIGNVLAVLAMAALFVSTKVKGKNKMIGIQSINLTLSFSSCIILKGYSGAIQNLVGIARNICIIKGVSNTFLNFIFIVVGLILGIVFNNRGILGILPVCSGFVFSVVVVSKKATDRGIRIATTFSTFCWAVYSLIIQNYANFLANVIVFLSSIFYQIKYNMIEKPNNQ